ncbi:MAG: cytidylyltransferase domain-containing protein [Thermoanaerobaculia bacterium]
MRCGNGLVTVVQARTGSTRLPGKTLLPLAGSTVLARVLERVVSARLSGWVVVATTTLEEDDALAEHATRLGFPVFRGHPTDLLDRHLAAARSFGARYVAKIPSDCPLIDPEAVDAVLGRFLEYPDRYDYVSNLHPASWPDGNDVEVMRIEALAAAALEATRPFEREHTTPFLWERPERFRIGNVEREAGADLSMSHRFVLDYPEDYDFVTRVYAELYDESPRFGTEAILRLLGRKPGIASRNARWTGVNWYRHHLAELRTVSAGETRLVEGV